MGIETELSRVARNWTALGAEDPLWAILSHREKRGGRWDLEAFFATGRAEIAGVLDDVSRSGAIARGRALDFGCGVGRLSQALAAHFERVDGVDIAASMIVRAQELNRHADRCVYHRNERPDLSLFARAQFDLVYSNITLQHMATGLALGYIGEFVRVLKPAGVAVFQIPSGQRGGSPSHGRRLLRRAFVTVQALRGRPVMDMFGASEAEVRGVVDAAGAAVVDVHTDDAAGPHWTSRRYCVRRV